MVFGCRRDDATAMPASVSLAVIFGQIRCRPRHIVIVLVVVVVDEHERAKLIVIRSNDIAGSTSASVRSFAVDNFRLFGESCARFGDCVL